MGNRFSRRQRPNESVTCNTTLPSPNIRHPRTSEPRSIRVDSPRRSEYDELLDEEDFELSAYYTSLPARHPEPLHLCAEDDEPLDERLPRQLSSSSLRLPRPTPLSNRRPPRFSSASCTIGAMPRSSNISHPMISSPSRTIDAPAATIDVPSYDYTVSNETTTSLTLGCTSYCSLHSAFSKAQAVKPGLKELTLVVNGFFDGLTLLTDPKFESIEILKIEGEGRGMVDILQSVAHFCPNLKELELIFRGDCRSEGEDITVPTCHSLRILKLTGQHLNSNDFISLLDTVNDVYPNIRQLSMNVDQYKLDTSDQLLSNPNVTSQLQHPDLDLDVFEFTCQEVDQDAKQHLQQTVLTYYPNVVKTKIKDGVFLFRRIQGASEYMDEDGGDLSIPAHNVKLSIPPGALEERTKISIEVFSEIPTNVCLQDNEVVASLGFRCFPSGQTFQKPLTLSMPHCAVIADHEEVRMILHFGNEADEVVRIPLEISEYVIHSDRTEIHLHHFSWGIPTLIYNWLFPGDKSDRQTTKRMLCTPFIPQTVPEDQNCLNLRLRIYNEIPGLPEKIFEEEKSMNYVQIHPEEELIVKECSIDMSIICDAEDLHSEKKVFTKDLMQHSKMTVGIKFPQRKPTITLTIKQEREITMELSPGEAQEPNIASDYSHASPGFEGRCRSSIVTERQLLPVEPISLNQESIEASGSSLSIVPYKSVHDVDKYKNTRNPGCLTDDQLENISRQLPQDKFNAISVQLGFSSTETQNMRSSSNVAQDLYFTMLTKWQQKTGANTAKLVHVLENVGLKGTVEFLCLQDNSREDID